jgi:hypothetical protein
MDTLNEKVGALQETVEMLEEKMKTMTAELTEREAFIKLYALVRLFNIYKTVPEVQKKGHQSMFEFIEFYLDVKADVEDGAAQKFTLETLQNELDGTLGISIDAIVDVARGRHYVHGTELRTIKTQRVFIDCCRSYQFTNKYQQLAIDLVHELDNVILKRLYYGSSLDRIATPCNAR